MTAQLLVCFVYVFSSLLFRAVVENIKNQHNVSAHSRRHKLTEPV